MDDTIVAVASAAGGAGRGILRLSGCDVVQVLRACFDSPDARALDRSAAWCTEGNLRVAAPLRRVPCLLYLWPDQRSYTRQPSAEIHTLGSPPLLDACLQALCAAGARLARPGEFTLRAFLAGRLDLTQAEAVLGVIEAVSQRQLEVALTQLAGGLSARLQAAREQLLNLCADIEAGLDFVDEDLQFIAPADIARQLAEIDRALDHALQQMDSRGQRSPQPRVVLTGRPNVGKSTLWNRLLQHHAALVSATPGTTRDYLEDHLELGTTGCTLVDTAGLDPTAPTSAIDRAARQMTQRNQQQADLIVLCLDPHQPLACCELEQLQSAARPTVFVLTKCDDPASPLLTSWIASLPPAVDVVDQPTVVRLKFAGQRPAERQVLKVSSHTGTGLPELLAALQQHVAERDESDSSVVAATATRCRDSLRRAQAAVSRAREVAAISAGDELLAVDIRCALDELGNILGTVYTDDILDRIFRRFCIGK